MNKSESIDMTKPDGKPNVDDPERVRPRTFWWAFALVCLLGLLLRLPTAGSRSLWLDEAFSAFFSALPLHELWTEVPRYETHPPMYYTLLKCWRALFGSSELGLRSLSILASVLTIGVVAGAGRVLRSIHGGDAVALTGAFFLAINAGSIKYAQEARPYALETLAATIAILGALRLLEILLAPAVRPRNDALASVLVLGVSAGATMWLHDTGVVVAYGIWAGMTATLLMHSRSRHGPQALALGAAGLVALALWSPMLPMLVMQTSGLASMPFWIKAKPGDVLDTWFLVAGGGKILFVVTGALILAGLVVTWRSCRPQALYLAIVVFLPVTSILLVSFLVKPIFIARLFEWLTPVCMILTAVGVLRALSSRALKVGAVAVISALSFKATFDFYRSQPEDWRGVVHSIASQARPGDLVIGMHNGTSVAINYYAQQQPFPEILYLPGPFPALGLSRTYVGNLGAPRIMPVDIVKEHEILKRYRRVWLVERNVALYDPEDSVRREVAANRTLKRRVDTEGITYELYE